jgi:hypothetical protein
MQVSISQFSLFHGINKCIADLQASTPTVAPTSSNSISSYSSWTYYNAYPQCCKDQANYDPTYPTTECLYYNGCAHPGSFAAIGQRSLSYVEK